jgi:putative ABC transport system permease protein
MLSGIILFFLTGAIISAVYPGLILSSFKPVSVLKGKFRSSAAGNALRKGFTIAQFAASITLIVGTLTVYQQLSYMRSKDLGMNINQILVLNNPDVVDSTFASKISFFKNELSKHKEISYAVSSTSIPGKTDNLIKGGLMLSGRPKETGLSHYGFQIDHNFIEAYDIKVLAGRNFSKDFGLDKKAVIINLAALQTLGLKTPEEAIGKKIETNWTDEKTIIGVVDNFHQSSLKTAYDPIVFVLDEKGEWGYYSVKLNIDQANDKNLSEVIATIHDIWNQAFPGNPFDYFFLDDYFNEQFKSDQRFGKSFALFSGLAIIVACLGLFGLVSFTTTQRTKEIGVRKVLGASISHIVVLLSKDFMRLVIIANLIAWPVSYWIIRQWLQNYAFRIEINLWLFVWPTLLVLCIALLTMGLQTMKAARTNPIKSLRYE